MSKEKMSLKMVKQLPPTTLLRILKKMKNKLKNDEVVQKTFKDYGLDIEELEHIPMMFKTLDVSAKCDHAIIYFNWKLLCDGDFEKHYSYAAHELTHFCQQTTGTKPTKSSDDGNYLDNPFEQEGFQNQIEYIAKQDGKEEAENYVDNLLEHHEIDSAKERDNKKETLMSKV